MNGEALRQAMLALPLAPTREEKVIEELLARMTPEQMATALSTKTELPVDDVTLNDLRKLSDGDEQRPDGKNGGVLPRRNRVGQPKRRLPKRLPRKQNVAENHSRSGVTARRAARSESEDHGVAGSGGERSRSDAPGDLERFNDGS
ncbi:MAG: hypothetical protein V3T13_07310 [Hyphomicrobium sp.]